MKTLALITLALLGIGMTTSAFARDFLKPGDIERADTSQAIITVSTKANPDNVRAIRFPVVPDLQSCFSLAYTAAAKTGGQSSATCINAHGVVAATYFCKPGSAAPECQTVPRGPR